MGRLTLESCPAAPGDTPFRYREAITVVILAPLQNSVEENLFRVCTGARNCIMFEDCRRLQALHCEGYNATCPAPGADESWQGGSKGGKNEGPEILSIALNFPARPTFTEEREREM